MARPATKPETDDAGVASWSNTLSEKEFQQIRELAHKRFGLDLRDGKQQLVAARLGKKIRQGGFPCFADYYRHVTADASGQALVELIDALATNHTAFLRERAHFDLLTKFVRAAPGRLPAIWSAACSTGEEPYTIVFTVSERFIARARPAHAALRDGHRHFDASAGSCAAGVLSAGPPGQPPGSLAKKLPGEDTRRTRRLAAGEAGDRLAHRVPAHEPD